MTVGPGGRGANPFGISAFGGGVSSAQNGGIGMASGQGFAFSNLFGLAPGVTSKAQGTGNGIGFGK